jgi:hypothetical protein
MSRAEAYVRRLAAGLATAGLPAALLLLLLLLAADGDAVEAEDTPAADWVAGAGVFDVVFATAVVVGLAAVELVANASPPPPLPPPSPLLGCGERLTPAWSPPAGLSVPAASGEPRLVEVRP